MNRLTGQDNATMRWNTIFEKWMWRDLLDPSFAHDHVGHPLPCLQFEGFQGRSFLPWYRGTERWNPVRKDEGRSTAFAVRLMSGYNWNWSELTSIRIALREMLQINTSYSRHWSEGSDAWCLFEYPIFIRHFFHRRKMGYISRCLRRIVSCWRFSWIRFFLRPNLGSAS